MKVNNLSLNKKEETFKQDLEYEEYLDSLKPLNENDLNHMEQVSCKANILKRPKCTFNNVYFQALNRA